jgi:transposase
MAAKLYADSGRPSIAPERLLRALPLQVDPFGA